MQSTAAIQINRMSGSSKSNSFFPSYLDRDALVGEIGQAGHEIHQKRMAKIQTMSLAWISTSATARVMNEISATPVTPQVSKASAVGPRCRPHCHLCNRR